MYYYYFFYFFIKLKIIIILKKIIGQRGGASQGRVCYQRGLLRLFFFTSIFYVTVGHIFWGNSFGSLFAFTFLDHFFGSLSRVTFIWSHFWVTFLGHFLGSFFGVIFVCNFLDHFFVPFLRLICGINLWGKILC